MSVLAPLLATATLLIGSSGPALANRPDRFATCEEQAAWFSLQTRPRPDERPTLWWLERDDPCPFECSLVGSQPPEGRYVGCEDRGGRRYGWWTEFGDGGKIASQSHWERNREMGPRLEWDPVSYEVSRLVQLREGHVEGETVEWLPDGVLVTTLRRSRRDGPTWRLDERGRLVMIEWWRDNQRHGRTCTWRVGQLAVDQVYAQGQPTTW